ncbi:hypothetical protein JAO73_17895 [Hymenobacter sp. BT523]|uniref:hypothetical protein n=1 Tax=Hymenobacter sp. BT523 TaxID=2795725 RepID=UPI0018EB9495|nr:hypothetical protein [Hymenobacter sp. BT523]MBJ6110900.1 hypothetical protein [Hymenobacter sp. BT523]
MKLISFALLLAAAGALVACNGSPVNNQPATGALPAPAPATPDTTRPARAGRAVPFVPPTKVGRVLGNGTPSPPNSRTR